MFAPVREPQLTERGKGTFPMPANLALAEPISRNDPAYDADIAREAEAWLAGLPDDFLACYRSHNFPKLKARNGRFPKGITARPIPEVVGHFQITQRCRDCGIRRSYSCTASDVFGSDRHYEYDWPNGYNMPKGAAAYITWSSIQAERNRRFGEALIGLAVAA